MELAIKQYYPVLTVAYLRGLKRDASMTVTEWAEAFRILPSETARPGRFKMSVTPYNREISDRLSVNDPAQKIIFKKSSQIGATETGNNWLGYVIDRAPANFLYIMPTDALMKKTSKTRIQKMIDSTPRLREKVAASKSRNSSNTLLEKYFDGGSLTMIGANSPVGLASTAIRFVYMDEIDRYPLNVGGEGSALGLAETRTATFGARKKIFLTSTPTLAGTSAIDAEFQKTGQRYYFVPCPLCGHMQLLRFENLKYTKDKYQDAAYECQECSRLLAERYKTGMLKAGEWRPLYPDREDGITYGYHLNAMYSPYGMFSWAQMAKEYVDATGDAPKMIVFINTKLGEVYEGEATEKLNWQHLYERAENYEQGKLFASVVFLTAGVDVQVDRLEIEIVGWMKGKTSQSVEYMQIVGDTAQSEVWQELSRLLTKTWIREGDNAILPLWLMAVDTGYNTQKVYDFVQKHGVARVIPIKGRDSLDMFFTAPKTVDVIKAGKKVGKVKVWNIGVSLIKSEVYGFLKLGIDPETGSVPAGYCHFPIRDAAYFRGLTAEVLEQVKDKKGFDKYQWVKKYKRNEPLDCRVYARAAAAVVGMDRWPDERWTREANVYDTHKPQQVNAEAKNRKSNFW